MPQRTVMIAHGLTSIGLRFVAKLDAMRTGASMRTSWLRAVKRPFLLCFSDSLASFTAMIWQSSSSRRIESICSNKLPGRGTVSMLSSSSPKSSRSSCKKSSSPASSPWSKSSSSPSRSMDRSSSPLSARAPGYGLYIEEVADSAGGLDIRGRGLDPIDDDGRRRLFVFTKSPNFSLSISFN